MIYTEMTKKALLLMYDAHKEQRDKGGLPYVFHPFSVAEQMKDEKTTIVALLHDVAEDSTYTVDDIKSMGFSDDIIDALTLLKHDKSVSYRDYIVALSSNSIARVVKIADLKHNSDASRLCIADNAAKERLKKYSEALCFLESL
jgi:(p)ppGpp synthase/HD superfamily hydrolase